MPTYSLSRTGRLYVAKQSDYHTIRHTGGTASLAAGDACKHRTFSCTIDPGRIPATDKEDNNLDGYVDRTRPGGKRPSSFASTHALRGTAGAGSEPDYGPLLEVGFGKKTVNAGTSVVYEFDPSAIGQAVEMWSFDEPEEVTQWCAFGCLPNQMQFALGQENAEVSFSGPTYWGLSNDQFSTAATKEKGGLTAFPSEPASQTYTGSQINAATGSAVIDGTTFNDVRSAGISINMNRAYDMEVFGEPYGGAPYEDVPEVLLDFSIRLSSLAALATLRTKALARTAVDATITIGATAGGIYTFAFKRLILPYVPTVEEAGRVKILNFRGCRAQMNASTGARDEVTLTLT